MESLPEGKFVFYYSIERLNSWDSVDSDEALHPKTLVAHGFDGGDLTYFRPNWLSVRKREGCSMNPLIWRSQPGHLRLPQSLCDDSLQRGATDCGRQGRDRKQHHE